MNSNAVKRTNFFLPTCFKVFKNHPRFRMFFATFMAAGVGNALFHFLREIDRVNSMGVVAALESYGSYLFYCVVLATGMGMFSDESRNHSFMERARYLLSLFGL